MAKSEELSVEAYRRQQRKKELKKNKSARIKARDEKVAATLSIDDVKAEISQLERKRDRNNDKSGLDAHEIKKLERLQKELRIVAAESVKRKALAEQAQIERDKELLAAQKTVAGVKKLNESKYSLEERYASVYYDERMNPFGAPAPGQPKLYYADIEGKTTTMDSRRAVVPAQLRGKFDLERGIRADGLQTYEDAARVAKERRWDDSGDINSMHRPIESVATPQYALPPPQFPPHPQHLVHNGALPPPPKQMPPPPPPPSMPHPTVHAPPPPPPPPPPDVPIKTKPPPLPEPSKAVLRAAKRSAAGKSSALADIWASQEEVEYEQTLNGTTMEGTAEQQSQPYLPRWKRNKTNAKAKEYLSDVNDPCCPNADGYGEYRNRDQIERQSKDVARLQRQQQDHAANLVAAVSSSLSAQLQSSHSLSATSFYTVHQSVWYYQDNTSGAIQGPFSGEQMMGWRAFFPSETPVRFGHDSNGKFVPLLEVDFVNSSDQLVPPPPPPDETLLTMDKDSMAIKVDNSDVVKFNAEAAQWVMPSMSAEDDPSTIPEKGLDPEVDICIPPLSDDDGDDSRDEYREDIDSFEKKAYPEVETCIPPPTDNEADEENELGGSGDEHEVHMCVPPPSDDDDDEEEENTCHVPPSADEEDPYPNDEEIPYPEDVEYPVEDIYCYPVDSRANDDVPEDMAAVAPYPSDVVFGVVADEEGKTEDQSSLPPLNAKKKFNGDRAVVGFVPSHLRVKRNVAKPSKPKPTSVENVRTNSQDETQGLSSVAGDYNKFMEEIAQLK